MTQQLSFTQRTGVRRLISTHSLLLVTLVMTAFLLSGIPAGAESFGFDDDGVVITDHSQFDRVNDVVIQPDGKIVAAGRTGDFFDEFTGRPSSMMVARYNSNGSLDDTFGTGGIVTTEFDGYAEAMGVALQADGKIVVAGTGGSSANNTLFAVVRYNTDGSLDETFAFGGVVTRRFGFVARIMDLAIQSDGKIIVAGEGGSRGGATLARYNPDGLPDVTFGDSGVTQVKPASFGFSSVLRPRGMQLQTDQKSVVAGGCVIANVSHFCVSRYNEDGSLDNTFDFDGVAVTDLFNGPSGSEAVDLAIQPDGKIVVAGQLFHEFGSVPVLARYEEQGFLDPTFNNNVVEIFSSLQFRPNAVTLKSDGKIVIAGEASFIPESPSMMAVVFCNSDSSIDQTLGGIQTRSVGTMPSAATSVAIQTDGRILAAGYANFSNEFQPVISDFALALFGNPINHPPVVTITGPASGSIFAVNTPVDFTGTFTDDAGDTHVIEWKLESSSLPGPSTLPVSETESGSVHTIVAFTDPGVYKFSLTVTDNNLLSDTATTVDGLEALVVVYDPDGGWVAGGGWIDSPPGAFALMPALTGKANFGFVSKYQNGASVPTGNMQFHFNAGSLNFESTGYEWMVISGGKKAQYKGAGTINGSGSYNFMLTAIDGDQPGGGGQDKFRIRIWSDSNGLIYDNQLNAPDGSDPTTVLGGGNIVIHH